MINIEDVPTLLSDYQKAKSRLILLDYDGTLVPFELHPDLTRPSASAKTLIRRMASDVSNTVILISGRDKENLDAYWGDLNIVLAAEHGAFIKKPKGIWEKMFPYTNTCSWLQKATSALHALSFQYEGSFVEKKSFSVAWHYRAIANIVENDKRQILAAIRALPFQDDFLITDSEYTLELRTRGVDKGSAVSRWVANQQFDFMMAIGDSQTDEDIFKLFGKQEYTIKVGDNNPSHANFYLKGQERVLPFLHHLLTAVNGTSSEEIQPASRREIVFSGAGK